MLPKKLAMTLLGLSGVAAAWAAGQSATVTTVPSPAVTTKALEVQIQTQDMGQEVYCYTWCEAVGGGSKSPFTWDDAISSKFKMTGSGGTYTLSIPDIAAFYGLTDTELAGLTKLGFIARTTDGRQTSDLFVNVEQGRRDVYGGGEGTQSNPFILTESAHLEEFATTPADWAADVYVQLGADIDASGLTSGIGSAASPYKGTFDGAGHSVTGFSVTSAKLGVPAGFFNVIDGARISNLGVADARVEGVAHVGALAGIARQGVIERCFATGSVEGNSICVGGLVGENTGATIRDCYAAVDVINSDDYATGGIVGKNSGLISNVYATGSVAGKDYVGGIAGANYGTLSHSVAINSKVSGGHDYVARFGGNGNARNISTSNHSWDLISTSADAWSQHGDHATQQSAATLTDFAGFKALTEWDFDKVWEWAEEDGLKYPRLRGMANQSCTLPSALLSVITVVEEVGYADTLSIEIGPNPFAEYLRVACSEPLKAVELYAIGGQKVAGVVCSGNSEVTIQADALTPGIYVLNAVTLSGAAHTYKVTKK